jgi:hypothetical protein
LQESSPNIKGGAAASSNDMNDDQLETDVFATIIRHKQDNEEEP